MPGNPDLMNGLQEIQSVYSHGLQKREIGDFRLSIIQSAMEDHPDLTVETALKMMEEFGA